MREVTGEKKGGGVLTDVFTICLNVSSYPCLICFNAAMGLPSLMFTLQKKGIDVYLHHCCVAVHISCREPST